MFMMRYVLDLHITNGTINDCVTETIHPNCTVTNRNFNESSDCNYYNGEDIKLHFTISYTSSICNVTYFPKIFQNHTNGHRNQTLDGLKSLQMNSITNIDKARRIRSGISSNSRSRSNSSSSSSSTSEMTTTTTP